MGWIPSAPWRRRPPSSWPPRRAGGCSGCWCSRANGCGGGNCCWCSIRPSSGPRWPACRPRCRPASSILNAMGPWCVRVPPALSTATSTARPTSLPEKPWWPAGPIWASRNCGPRSTARWGICGSSPGTWFKPAVRSAPCCATIGYWPASICRPTWRIGCDRARGCSCSMPPVGSWPWGRCSVPIRA